MSVWKVARSTKVCALSGKPLPPDAPVVTALFGAEEEAGEDKVRGTGFVRRDFLVDETTPEALEKALSGAYCTWHGRTPPATPKPPRLDLSLARDLLERLVSEADPARAAVAMAVALLLVRKRALHLVSQGDGSLVLRWPKTDAPFRVGAVDVTPAEEEALQQELARLFGS